MRVPLNLGAYTARSVIASAQRAVNIFPEVNPKGSECQFTHYGAPGIKSLGIRTGTVARGLYAANNGFLYYCAGQTVYLVLANWTLQDLGDIAPGTTPVSFADNGSIVVLVDGTSQGWQIDMLTQIMTPISENTNAPPDGSLGVYGFYGADRVDMIDGFMVFNQPQSRNFYSTYNNEVVFDALYFAAKNGFSDNLVSIVVCLRIIWLIGQKTSENWFDAGSADFPFSIVPGPFIQHGCSAKYSIAQVDGSIFWLSQDQAGNNILVQGRGGVTQRVSNHAIETEWSLYTSTSDAVGFCFQLDGHAFYQINFPTANRTWRYDMMSEQWHEAVWTDSDGGENRHRAQCYAFAYNTAIVADWETGELYRIGLDIYDDNGSPMYWRRGFPHMMQDGRQVIFPGFALDIQAATSPDSQDDTPNQLDTENMDNDFGVLQLGIDEGNDGIFIGPAPVQNAPQVLLRMSDDRGRTWGQGMAQSYGATGQYLVQPQWNRLGRARDRVFEVYGAIPGKLALNGAFLDPEPKKLGS